MTMMLMRTIRLDLFFFLCCFLHSSLLVDGQNVVMTSSGAAIATNGGEKGLLVSKGAGDYEHQQFDITNFGSGVSFFSPFDDVSVDPINESLVFALSTSAMTVCSFFFDDEATDDSSMLQLVGCVGVFSVSPFCGVSAYGGTLMVSGGIGGFTIFEYDRQSGLITDTPTLLNQLFPNIVGHPDVVLVNANLAALSTDFVEGLSPFGTQMASIDASRSSVAFGLDYRVQNTLGFELMIQPSNFPLVNALYRSSAVSRMPLMYTANGSMQVQDLSSNEITLLSGAPDGFSAVTVAVNQAKHQLYLGGVMSSGGSQILIYDLAEDPMNPTLVDSRQDCEQRITSIASGGDFVAFMTTTNPGKIQFLESLPNAADCNPEPTDAPSSDKNSGGSASLLKMGIFVCAAVLSAVLF